MLNLSEIFGLNVSETVIARFSHRNINGVELVRNMLDIRVVFFLNTVGINTCLRRNLMRIRFRIIMKLVSGHCDG